MPKLARMRGDAEQTLAKMRSSSRALSGTERVEALNALLRPGMPSMFSWEAVGARSGLTTKDFVCPSSLDFKPEGSSSCFKSGDTWCQVLVLGRFGSELSDRCIADIIDLPVPLAISIHVQALDKSKAVAFVKKRIAWMDKEIIDEQMSAVKKGYDFQILPSELKYSKEEAEDLLDHLQNKNQRLYVYTGLVYTYAATRDGLDDQVMQIVSTARRNSIEADALDYRQREGLNSVLPLGHNHVEVSRMMTTAQVAIQMPFATQELSHEGGGYYGQNKQSSNLVLCNRKKLASPMGFVAGKPGSGKSFSVKREIENTILAYPDDEIIVLDPAGEYAPVVEANCGECIRFAPDADTHLNPFDLADVSHQSRSSQMAFKIDAFLALSSATMAEGDQGLPEADKSIISRCVEEAYREAAGEGRVPLLGDFHRILKAQPEREGRDIALRYERYVTGALAFFNHPSNVTFERRITNVDFKDLSQNMRVFGMLTALEAVRNRMYANFERGVTTWLYIDEVQSLFGHPSIIQYFSRFWAEGRKFNLVATGITQNSVYMLEHEEARNMVLNSDFILLHKQSPLDRRAWADLLDMSSQEADYIDESIQVGEGLLIAGGARVPIKDRFPRGPLYDLFNTKPDEIAAIAEEILPNSRGEVIERDYGQEDMRVVEKCRREAMEVSMPQFLVGFKCPPAADGAALMRQDIIADIACDILLGDSSPLYQRLYDKGLINGSFGGGFDQLPGIAYLYAGGDSDAPETVVRAILDEAQRLAREGVDEAFYQQLRRASFGSTLRALNSFENIAVSVADGAFRDFDPFRFPEVYDSVTRADVETFLRESIVEERSALSILIPKKEGASQ